MKDGKVIKTVTRSYKMHDGTTSSKEKVIIKDLNNVGGKSPKAKQPKKIP